MRMRYLVYAFLAAGGLILGGCGKADTTPPPDVVDETPVLDIDEGSQVSPEEINKQKDGPGPATEESGGGDAAGDAK